MPNRASINSFQPRQINDRPVRVILEELTTDELSRLAVDVIVKNRRLVDRAQLLFEQLEEPVSAGCEDEDLRHSYCLALLEMKLHHELVRIVVDTLGHVPEVPLDSGPH